MAATAAVPALPRRERGDLWEHLTLREIRVLRMIAYGCSDPEMATVLGITRNTVRGHRRGVIRKLEAVNAPNAVALAYEHGILP